MGVRVDADSQCQCQCQEHADKTNARRCFLNRNRHAHLAHFARPSFNAIFTWPAPTSEHIRIAMRAPLGVEVGVGGDAATGTGTGTRARTAPSHKSL